MKLNELKKQLSRMLEPCSEQDAEFEAVCILSDIIGCTNSALVLYSDTDVDDEVCFKAMSFVKRRLESEPLQYILGKWEFYGREFYVGDGVLIPRPETELLAQIASQLLKEKAEPVCYDLCSGSGCIGITVFKQTGAEVFMLEKSEKAYSFLEKNIQHNCAVGCRAVLGDLFNGCCFEKKADVIVSNPPYIRSEVIDTLRREVKKEPLMALDGGEDGLMFYRAIADLWVDSLKPDGVIAVEIGEDQGEQVCQIFSEKFKSVELLKDYSSLDRIVIAKQKY